MAYSRSSRKPRRSYRKSGSKRRSSARPSRYTAKTRRYTRKPRTSKRKLVDMTSVKKRDTMIVASAGGINPDPKVITVTGRIAQLGYGTVDASGIHVILFNPTHRWLVPNNAAYQAYRTSTRPFLKGLLERVELNPTDGSTWWWRRIIFAIKGRVGNTLTTEANIGAQATSGATSYRQFRDLSGEASGNYFDTNVNMQATLFEGVVGTDWLSPMSAKIDRSRVTLIKDKSRMLSSGNDWGKPKIYRDYTPINKTLVYDDEENGLSMNPSPLSTSSKAGIGNIYVVDFFQCPRPANAGTPGSGITVNPQSTLYWHEK